jgi:hypothetical protein
MKEVQAPRQDLLLPGGKLHKRLRISMDDHGAAVRSILKTG